MATVRVTPGESLAVFVGSEFIQWSTGSNRRGLGGYNGGGILVKGAVASTLVMAVVARLMCVRAEMDFKTASW